MSSYREIDIPQVKGIKAMLARVQAKITELENSAGSDSAALKAVAVSGNTVNFYTTSDTTGTAAFTFDFPEEMFLNQLGTEIVENFTWSAASYPNSTNPNLDGKTVLVLAVKGDKTTNPTLKYSFVNMEKLVDTYTASDTSITINGYEVAVKISAAANNAITLQNDGLHVDISGKMNKVAGATTGNIAVFGSDTGVVDSGSRFCTDAEFTAMLDEVFPAAGGGN